MSFSNNYDLNPFPYVGSTEGFQQMTAQDVSYNEISNILRESKEFSEEEIKEISECVYSESADDVVMERSVEKILIKSYRKNYKKVFKNIRRIKLYMFQHKYDEAHMLVTETISDLIEMKKETEALALDPGKYDLPVLIKIFAFIIKQLVIIIDTILVAVIPVFRHFAVSETKTLSKTKHMLPGNVNADTDFITLKHRILDVYDELIATLTSIDGKISVEKEKCETRKSNSNIVESTHVKSDEVVSDMNNEKDMIKRESVDVDESSSSFLGQMLPQIPIMSEEDYNSKEVKDLAKSIDTDYLNDDLDMFDPNSDILESDIMTTESGFIELLKSKFGKKDDPEGINIDTKLVTDACRLYSKNQNAQNRMKLMLVRDSAAKSTEVYRDYAKTLVVCEKQLRVLKKRMSSTELNIYNNYCKKLDGSLKHKMKESIADIKEANIARSKIKMECGDTPFFDGDVKSLSQTSSNLYESLHAYSLKLDILFLDIKKKLNVQNYCSVVNCFDTAIGIVNCSRKTVISQLSQAEECNDTGCPDMVCIAFDHVNEIMDKVHNIISCYSVIDMPRIVTCMKCTCDSQSSLSSNISSIVGAYNSIINTINQLKVHTESLCNNSTYTSEAADIDTAIADSVIALNNKGYKTKYSSAGHNKLKPWKDGDGDGEYEGVLNSDARIQFDGSYEFPKAPKYWKWRSVGGNDYLDVVEIKYDKKDGTPPEAFQKWKNNYLSTLATWVKNLPNAKPIVKEKDVEDKDVPEETPKEISKENDVKESVEEMFDSMMETLFIEASF